MRPDSGTQPQAMAPDSATLMSLPDEVIGSILEQAAVHYRRLYWLAQFSLVNRRIAQVLRRGLPLWSSLDLDQSKLMKSNTAGAARSLESFLSWLTPEKKSVIKEIRLGGRQVFACPVLLIHLGAGLRSLSLKYNGSLSELQQLVDCVSGCSKLEQLELLPSSTLYPARLLMCGFAPWRNLTSLRSLSISDHPLQDGLGELVMSLPHLTRLQFYAATTDTVKGLEGLVNLQELTLSHYWHPSRNLQLQSFDTQLQSLTALTLLDLSECSVQALNLAPLSRLQALTIRGCPDSRLPPAISSMQALSLLEFDRCEFWSLLESLSRLTSLASLSIMDHRANLEMRCSMLDRLSRLQTIRLTTDDHHITIVGTHYETISTYWSFRKSSSLWLCK